MPSHVRRDATVAGGLKPAPRPHIVPPSAPLAPPRPRGAPKTQVLAALRHRIEGIERPRLASDGDGAAALSLGVEAVDRAPPQRWPAPGGAARISRRGRCPGPGCRACRPATGRRCRGPGFLVPGARPALPPGPRRLRSRPGAPDPGARARGAGSPLGDGGGARLGPRRPRRR